MMKGASCETIEDRESLALAASVRALEERLRAMIVHADLIEQGLLTRSERRSAARAIRKLGEESAALAERMREVLIAGAPALQTADVCSVVKDEARALRETLPTGVQLRVTTPAEPLPVSHAPAAIALALRELVTQAADAMRGRGGVVQVTVHCEPQAGENPACAVIEVSDSGPALSAAERAHVLDSPFENPRSVALAAAREVAERHGGRLELPQAPGPGTLVRMRFPLAR
jgi:signal transduction histidine kinase